MMLWLLIVGIALATAWAYFSFAATVSLIAAESISQPQKFAQGLFVWLVPFFGAWLVLHLLADSEPAAVSRSMIGSRGLGWYIIAGAYDGPWRNDGGDVPPPTEVRGETDGHHSEPSSGEP